MNFSKKIHCFSMLGLLATVAVNLPATAISQGSDLDTTNLPVLKAMPLRLETDFSKAYKLPDDMEGKGFSSLFWINKKTNQFAYWVMGTRLQGDNPDGYVASRVGRTGWKLFSVAPGYSVAAIGDLNGNGLPDLVWTSSAHDLYAWFKDANSPGYSSRYIGSYPSGWKLIGAGDINGDGLADLIWYNEGSCQFGYWIMKGDVVTRTKAINVACGYHVAAVGDINGNGLLDIVWNGPQNDIYVWYGNGSGFKSIYGGSYPQNKELMAVGIFDGIVGLGFRPGQFPVRVDRFNLVVQDKSTKLISLMEWVADKPDAEVSAGTINFLMESSPANMRFSYRLGPVAYRGPVPSEATSTGGRYANAITILSGRDDSPPFYFPPGTFQFRSMVWNSTGLTMLTPTNNELSNYPDGGYIPRNQPMYDLGYPEDWEIIGSSVGR